MAEHASRSVHCPWPCAHKLCDLWCRAGAPCSEPQLCTLNPRTSVVKYIHLARSTRQTHIKAAGAARGCRARLLSHRTPGDRALLLYCASAATSRLVWFGHTKRSITHTRKAKARSRARQPARVRVGPLKTGPERNRKKRYYNTPLAARPPPPPPPPPGRAPPDCPPPMPNT